MPLAREPSFCSARGRAAVRRRGTARHPAAALSLSLLSRTAAWRLSRCGARNGQWPAGSRHRPFCGMSLALALLERLDGERARRLAGHASFRWPGGGLPQSAPVTVGRMPHRPPLGLFDNEVRLYGLDELTETVRLLERS
jgi:hypothetical protein